MKAGLLYKHYLYRFHAEYFPGTLIVMNKKKSINKKASSDALANKITKNSKVTLKSSDLDSVDIEYKRLFDSFKHNVNNHIERVELLAKLRDCGILSDDPRYQATIKSLDGLNVNGAINFEQFKQLVGKNGSVLKKVIRGNMAIPDFADFQHDLEEIFKKVKVNKSGEVASYIPQLGRVNPQHFAVSVCTVDGQRFSLGDAQTDFCLQSVSKPISYCLALEEHGEEKVHDHVGREPSGRGFNELTLNNEGLPHNPLINSGAIMSCSLIKPKQALADRFEYVSRTWQRLAGNGRIGFNNPVYLSERETADRNFALGYFMREKKAFPEGTDLVEALEFYFQCCSIEVNADELAIVAASLANGGVCPTTGDGVFQPQTVQNCLSLMSSCGMYDFSGEFAFSIGLPAKSGVSGGILVVIPQVMGIAIWSPRLDALGNSVRGLEFCRELVRKFNFHLYDSLTHEQNNKRDPRLKKKQTQIEGVVNLCWAASQGDVNEVQKLAAQGVDLNAADYDGRTALHLAASEGQTEIVNYLIAKGVNLEPIDRWGGTPLSDAKRGGHQAISEVLQLGYGSSDRINN